LRRKNPLGVEKEKRKRGIKENEEKNSKEKFAQMNNILLFGLGTKKNVITFYENMITENGNKYYK